MAFKLKLDSEGKVALGSNGQPVFIDDEKGDEEFTCSQVQENWGQRLASVSGEAGGYRKEKAALKKELDKWASLEKDFDEISDMIEKFDKIDLSKMTKAEEVQAKIDAATAGLIEKNNEMKKTYDKKIVSLEEEKQGLKGNLHKLVISKSFAANSFFNDKEKTLLSPDMAELLFGGKFRVEDGVAVCYPEGFNEKGEPIGAPMYSHQDPGKTASFDEAVGHLWEAYPNKDRYTPPAGGGDHQRGDRGPAGGGSKSLLEQSAEALKSGNVQEAIRLKNMAYNESQGQGGGKNPPAQ